jgi:hypothetical protein
MPQRQNLALSQQSEGGAERRLEQGFGIGDVHEIARQRLQHYTCECSEAVISKKKKMERGEPLSTYQLPWAGQHSGW